MASAILTHCGAVAVSEDEVRGIPVPAPDKSWRPIPHGLAIDLVEKSIVANGFKIERKAFALQNGIIPKRDVKWEGAKMFGVYDLKLPWTENGEDYSMAVGLRNSMDMSFAYSLVGGSRVFVCDNLAFSGTIEMRRKHTAGILDGLETLVDETILRVSDLFIGDSERFEAWRTREITLEGATDFLCEVNEAGALPIRAIPAIRELFRGGTIKGTDGAALGGYDAFADPTVWSLYNHFSEFAKTQRINALDHAKRSQKQTDLFRRRFPVTKADHAADPRPRKVDEVHASRFGSDVDEIEVVVHDQTDRPFI